MSFAMISLGVRLPVIEHSTDFYNYVNINNVAKHILIAVYPTVWRNPLFGLSDITR
jgi:hypothetical protein